VRKLKRAVGTKLAKHEPRGPALDPRYRSTMMIRTVPADVTAWPANAASSAALPCATLKSAASLVADAHHVVAQQFLLMVACRQQRAQTVVRMEHPEWLVVRIDDQYMDEAPLVHHGEHIRQ